ncbi:hypothetical protein O1611_g2516 [Lasiodiplodia mahajangana]|uniref:Uncharacterized protein n=1 Tax=Lasiodiplodia mahajangana TaxID=1108764 RepID=A0ACC2JUV6_9PEZI|nr:hypothetical protein O1611_g2516 [Lasiodiplodia mahajangana]
MTTARTNLGPLTTSFSYPAHCTVAGVQDDPQCWPARRNPYLSTGVALNGWGFYSPGLSCPFGYATSCVATGTVDGGFPFQFPLLDSETVVGCCPTIATTGSFAAVGCSSGTSNDFRYYNVPATVTETVGRSSTSLTAMVISTVTILAPLFQLNYQSTDLSSSQTSLTTQTTVSTPANTDMVPAPSNSSSSSLSAKTVLSSGAKAGIGVGAGIGGLLILGAASFFCFRRRKSSNPVSELMAVETPPAFAQHHTQPAELSSHSYRSELPQYK